MSTISTTHEFPDGTIVKDQGSVVIFGGGDEAAMNDPANTAFGGAIVQLSNEGSNGVNLASDKDTIVSLLNEHGFEMDAVKFLVEDANQSQSLTRSPDITGDFPSLHFDVSSAFLLFSPGADINGTAFPGNGAVLPETDVFGGVDIPDFTGWKASPWYKNYNVAALPWIFHDEHGWQFLDSGSTEDVIFLYDLGLEGWIFVNEAAYRFIFLYGGPNEGWIFTFENNKPGSRFFQRTDGTLFSVPPDLPVN